MKKFEGLPKLRQNVRRLAPLIAALTLGLFAAILGWYYLKSSEREIAANLEKNADSLRINVVVAADTLAAGTAVTTDMVALRSVPKEFVHSDALTSTSFEEFSGQQLIVPVEKGKPLLAAFFADRKKVFSEQIEAGVRAITIPVDEISSISGMLRAGDRIDFMYMVESQQGGNDALIVPLLQDVEVRATGQITAQEFNARRNRPSVSATDDPYAEQRYSTVTVAVAPKEVQKLILAQRTGKIVAALRNPIDRDTLQSGTDAADLAAAVNSFRPMRETAPALAIKQGIEYIIGGSASAADGGLGGGSVPAGASTLGNNAPANGSASPEGGTNTIPLASE